MRYTNLIGIIVFCSLISCFNNKKEVVAADKITSVEVTSEESIPFDKEKWKIKVGRSYPYRDQMLPNMVFNEGLRSLKSHEILDVLGEPERIDNNHFFYRIDDKKIGAWTLRSKTLVIKFDVDSTLVWMKIHE